MEGKYILSINDPKQIFTSSDEKENKKIYLRLIKEWHPDGFATLGEAKIKEAEEVCKHINELYSDYVPKKVDLNYKEWTTKDGGKITLKYITDYPFELGTIYQSKTVTMYLLNKDKEKYYKNFKNTIANLKYYDSKMEKEMKKYFPQRVWYNELKDGYTIAIEKTLDVLSLRDVLNYYKGTIPDRTSAWIISSMYNIACYFDWANLVHNGITIDNYYISPVYHSGLLLGGWWYTVKNKENMIGCKKEIYDILPTKTKNSKISGKKNDMESIKLVGRTILGDSLGRRIKAPDAIREWANSPILTDNAIEEYKNWSKVLDRAYGKREFIPLDLTWQTIY